MKRMAMLIKFLNTDTWNWVTVKTIEVETDKDFCEKGDIVHIKDKPLLVYEDLGPHGALRVFKINEDVEKQMTRVTNSTCLNLNQLILGVK